MESAQSFQKPPKVRKIVACMKRRQQFKNKIRHIKLKVKKMARITRSILEFMYDSLDRKSDTDFKLTVPVDKLQPEDHMRIRSHSFHQNAKIFLNKQ